MDIKPRLEARFDGTTGEFVLEPLARGFGVTIGNPLRRILLSSIPGTAVTSVYIEDVLHEFSTIAGVKEDVMHIVLNLKEMVVKFEEPGPKILNLRIEKGPKKVKAGDFEAPSGCEIVNPDLPIATVGESGRLVMEVRVEEGVGYVSAERHSTKERINSIPVDAIFSPVRRVEYRVEDTRVGQETDLDRLTLKVFTDGSITPADALDRAVNVLRNQLSVFDTSELLFRPQPAVKGVEPQPAREQGPRLAELGLTARVLHSLQEEGIDSVGALLALSERDLKKVPGIGEKSLDEIRAGLAKFGLYVKEA